MDRILVARELLLAVRDLVGIEFKTKEELEKYKDEHDVRPGTKLIVEKKDSGGQAKDRKETFDRRMNDNPAAPKTLNVVLRAWGPMTQEEPKGGREEFVRKVGEEFEKAMGKEKAVEFMNVAADAWEEMQDRKDQRSKETGKKEDKYDRRIRNQIDVFRDAVKNLGGKG